MLSAAQLQERIDPLFPGLLGMRLSEIGAERIVGTLKVRAELCTAGESLHGGAFMAFADTLGALGTMLNMPKGARTTTIESKTNFMGAAPAGSTITGEATPLHRGKTTQVWQTQIRGENGKLLAVVTQTQLIIPASA
jgi:1,4-dihydroxy-2-naphthoyl-CoA hydrolase